MWYGNNNNKVTGDYNHGCLELSDNVTILQNLMVNKIVSTVDVSYKGQVKKLGLLAVAGKGPSLLGHNWLSQLQLDWSQINCVLASTALACEEILDKHKTVLR